MLTIDPQAEQAQVERLRALRESRDAERARKARARLAAAAGEGAQLMPPILDCVRAEVTLGEIADTLREVFGEYSDQGF